MNPTMVLTSSPFVPGMQAKHTLASTPPERSHYPRVAADRSFIADHQHSEGGREKHKNLFGIDLSPPPPALPAYTSEIGFGLSCPGRQSPLSLSPLTGPRDKPEARGREKRRPRDVIVYAKGGKGSLSAAAQ